MISPPAVTPPTPATATSRQLRWRIGVALLAVYLIWGSTYYGIVLAMKGIPPLLMAGSRHLTAGTLLFVVLWARGVALPDRRQWLHCVALGVLFQAMGNGLVVLATQRMDSSLAAVLVASMPLWAGLWSGLWGQWPRAREWVGLLLGLAGVAVLRLEPNTNADGVGTAMVLVAAVAWAFGTVWSGKLNLPGGAMTAAVQMMAGGVVLLVGGTLHGEWAHVAPTSTAVAAWVYLTLAGNLGGYTAFVFLLRNTTRAVATSYAYVNPLVALALGVGLGGESFTAHRAGGGALILLGVVLMVLRR